MSQQQIILVTGATGAQGGSVVNALLKDKKFAVRIFTRNKQTAKAIALERAGAEIAEGSFDDMASIKKAMQGVYGVFAVTSFWEHFEKEYRHGKNIIDAVKECGVQHLVLSTLADYTKLSNGQFSVRHNDSKAALQQYAQSLHLPVTFIQLSFYYENFFTLFPLQKDESGQYFFAFPQGDTPLAATSVEDTGGVVATLFDHPRVYIGRTVRIVGEDVSCKEYAAILSKVLEQPVYYKHIPRNEFAQLSAAAKETADMFEVQRLYISNRQLDLIESYGLNTAMQPFKKWVQKNKEMFIRHFDMRRQVAVA